MAARPPHFTWSRAPCVSLQQVALEVRRAPSHAATCMDCSAPSYSFPLSLFHPLFLPTPKIKIPMKAGTPWNDQETPKLQTSEKWGAKRDQCIYNGHLSAVLHKIRKARELNIAFLNYRWAALTTKETQKKLRSGSNKKTFA